MEFVTYTFRFEGEVFPIIDPEEEEDFDGLTLGNYLSVRDGVYSVDRWVPYIVSIMRDALTDLWEHRNRGMIKRHPEYTESYNPPDVPIVGLCVIPLEEMQEASKLKGVVSWTSVEIDPQYIKEAIKWRIGDRMSHYEFIESGVSHTYIYPGGLTIS